MQSIYIDESGYTGVNLLDEAQPFQGAASLLIDEDSAKSLIDEHLPNIQAKELKHQSLSQRKKYWDGLINVQKTIFDNHMGFICICDKKYLLTLLFLESCLEPFYYNHEVNFYQDGKNHSLASLIYYAAPTFWGKENHNDLLLLFQRATKTKSDIDIKALIEKARSLMDKELSKEVLFPLAIEYEDCIDAIKNPQSKTDAAFIILFALISHIEKYINHPYEIVHDTSDNLLKYNGIINNFIANDDVKSFFATTETSLNFPLKLSTIRQEKSHLSYGVQLADILIGGAIEWAKSRVCLVI